MNRHAVTQRIAQGVCFGVVGVLLFLAAGVAIGLDAPHTDDTPTAQLLAFYGVIALPFASIALGIVLARRGVSWTHLALLALASTGFALILISFANGRM